MRVSADDSQAMGSASQSLSFTVDTTPAEIFISSPSGGEYVATQNLIEISFSATDLLDSAPQVTAALVRIQSGTGASGADPGPVDVTNRNGDQIEPLSLAAGTWRLEASATDHAGNAAAAQGQIFTIIHDIKPPRTTLAIGTPQSGNAPTYVTRDTILSFTAYDDLVEVGDGLGLGAAKVRASVNGALRAESASSALSLTLSDPDGPLTLSYFAEDILGNAETPQSRALYVDNTAPEVSINLNGPVFESDKTYISSDFVNFFTKMVEMQTIGLK